MKTEPKEEQTYPYYCFKSDQYQVKLESRFWNCQGKHIAIVTVVTRGVDWAAYIGTDAPESWDEDGTLKYVADKGCKLSKEEAQFFFPEIDLPYRA